MDFFDYRGDALYAEDVPVADLSAEFGTPLYIYSKATLLRHLHAYTDVLWTSACTDVLPTTSVFSLQRVSS